MITTNTQFLTNPTNPRTLQLKDRLFKAIKNKTNMPLKINPTSFNYNNLTINFVFAYKHTSPSSPRESGSCARTKTGRQNNKP